MCKDAYVVQGFGDTEALIVELTGTAEEATSTLLTPLPLRVIVRIGLPKPSLFIVMVREDIPRWEGWNARPSVVLESAGKSNAEVSTQENAISVKESCSFTTWRSAFPVFITDKGRCFAVPITTSPKSRVSAHCRIPCVPSPMRSTFSCDDCGSFVANCSTA